MKRKSINRIFLIFFLLVMGIPVLKYNSPQTAPHITSIDDTMANQTDNISWILKSSALDFKNATVISDKWADGTEWNINISKAPDIAVDNLGNLHVVWEDYTPGIWGPGSPALGPGIRDVEIMYANSTDNGESWSNATVISDKWADGTPWNYGISGSPKIAVDSSNNLHVVWDDSTNGTWGGGYHDYEIMYINYTSAGWSNATVISDKWDDGTQWNTNDSASPDIIVDNLDNLHVVWSDETPGPWGSVFRDYEIMYANYTSAGWSNATVISDKWDDGTEWNTGESVLPAIAVDKLGNLQVVWQDGTRGPWGSGGVDIYGDFEIMYANRTSAGWSNATVISDKWDDGTQWNTGYSRYPDIAVDNLNNIHIVWDDGTLGPWTNGLYDVEIMYANSTDNGESWSNATVISDKLTDGTPWNDGFSEDPAIAVDSMGNLHVVWTDLTSGPWGSGGSYISSSLGDSEIMYVNYTSAGWSNATVISDGYEGDWGWNTNNSLIPAIANSSDNIHVVWTDCTPGPWGSGGYQNDEEIMYTKITLIGGGAVPGGGGGGSPGDDDDDDDNDDGDGGEFNTIEFLTSPLGMVLIGGSAVVVVIIAIIKIKGSGKSRMKEIERIKKLKEE